MIDSADDEYRWRDGQVDGELTLDYLIRSSRSRAHARVGDDITGCENHRYVRML